MDAIYTAHASATGGRDGHARTDDGKVDVALSVPKEMGGQGNGTNPEQLFAAGWSACFEGAMAIAARARGITLPGDLAIDAEVALRHGEDGYSLAARLNVSVPGGGPDVARGLIEAAHRTCPSSKAIKGNIDALVALV